MNRIALITTGWLLGLATAVLPSCASGPKRYFAPINKTQMTSLQGDVLVLMDKHRLLGASGDIHPDKYSEAFAVLVTRRAGDSPKIFVSQRFVSSPEGTNTLITVMEREMSGLIEAWRLKHKHRSKEPAELLFPATKPGQFTAFSHGEKIQ